MATPVLGLKTFAASDPVNYNEINDNYTKIDNGVKTALQGRAAHNLLDNSDFRNPVNQRGKTSYTGEASKLTYTIDRWNTWDTHAKTEVTASGLKITGIDVTGYIAQLFEKPDKMIGKTYTLAAGMADGKILCGTATVPSTTQTEEYYITAVVSSDTTPGLRLQVAGNLSRVRFQFSVKPGKTYTIAWAALYEGSYDASTLPAYQPKGYAAELAECRRYYKKYSTCQFPITITAASWASGAIDYTDMRGTPTITYDLAGLYVADNVYTSITSITARTLPASELVINTGVSVAANKTGTIRFNSLALSCDL